MTTLETYRAILDQPVDGDQQPGHRWIWREPDPQKLSLRWTVARILRLKEKQA